MVFGYLCTGHVRQYTVEKRVYRFGRSKRLLSEAEYAGDHELAIERIGHRGLNRPEYVVLWFETSDVEQAWDVVRDLLRFNVFVDTETKRPESIDLQYDLGDNYVSVTGTNLQDFEKWLTESAEKLLHEIKLGEQAESDRAEGEVAEE